MKHSMVLVAVWMALAVSACDKPAVVTPAAQDTVPGSTGPTGATGFAGSPTRANGDPSLPAAAPATPTESPTSVRNSATPLEEMTKQEKDVAMPLPGQVNDHSSPAMHPSK